MPTFNSVADFMAAHPNLDAINWRDARDGDFIMRRESRQALEGCYVIDGVPLYLASSALVTWCKRVDGDPDSPSVRSAAKREFGWDRFMVWRDFSKVVAS
jgi:hypothetical protein